MKRNQPEQALHKAVAEYLDYALPPDAFWFPVPNASKRGVVQAALMKQAREMRPGVPDICLVYRGRFVGIELKAKGGYLSPAQKDVHGRVTMAGGLVTVIRSIDALYDFLVQIVPLKARP
jgi:hypothetical protein